MVAHNCHSNSKLLTAQTKIFTAKANDSQHKPKCSQQRKTGPLDLWTPGSLGPLTLPDLVMDS